MHEDLIRALDAVVVALRSAADHHQHAAEATDAGAPDLAGHMAELAREHRELAASLEAAMRRAGELPKAPDPDRQTLERVLTSLKAGLFSAPEQQPYRQRCLQAEEQVALAADEALALEPDEPWDKLLRRILQRAQAVRAELAAGA